MSLEDILDKVDNIHSLLYQLRREDYDVSIYRLCEDYIKYKEKHSSQEAFKMIYQHITKGKYNGNNRK